MIRNILLKDLGSSVITAVPYARCNSMSDQFEVREAGVEMSKN